MTRGPRCGYASLLESAVWALTAVGGNLYALGVFTKLNGRAVPRIAGFQG